MVGMVGHIVAGDFFIDGQDDAKALLMWTTSVSKGWWSVDWSEGWATLVEALRLLPSRYSSSWFPPAARGWCLGVPLICCLTTSPRNLMLRGRRQDLQSEIHISKTHTVWCLSHKRQLHPILTRSKPLHFDVIGSRWDLFYPDPNHVVYYVLKEAGEDWARLELYLDTEDMK